MDADEHALITQIVTHPCRLESRLVYADWLEERGDSACEFLRAECDWYKSLVGAPLRHDEKDHQRIEHLRKLAESVADSLLTTVAFRCSVVMLHWNNKKIHMVKLVRDALSSSLLETKLLVESAPCVIRQQLPLKDAFRLYESFMTFGGLATLTPDVLTPSLPDLASIRASIEQRTEGTG